MPKKLKHIIICDFPYHKQDSVFFKIAHSTQDSYLTHNYEYPHKSALQFLKTLNKQKFTKLRYTALT